VRVCCNEARFVLERIARLSLYSSRNALTYVETGGKCVPINLAQLNRFTPGFNQYVAVSDVE
jgi:hypothetical protein